MEQIILNYLTFPLQKDILTNLIQQEKSILFVLSYVLAIDKSIHSMQGRRTTVVCQSECRLIDMKCLISKTIEQSFLLESAKLAAFNIKLKELSQAIKTNQVIISR